MQEHTSKNLKKILGDKRDQLFFLYLYNPAEEYYSLND